MTVDIGKLMACNHGPGAFALSLLFHAAKYHDLRGIALCQDEYPSLQAGDPVCKPICNS